MDKFGQMYHYETTPLCDPKAVVQGEKYRFTVLTRGIIRMEYNEQGIFEDRATKGIINRKFPVPEFRVEESEDLLIITTENVQLRYLKKHSFSPETLTARYYGELANFSQTWTFKDYDRPYYPYPGGAKTRKGTIGSLDAVNPPIELEDGVISFAFADIDDSGSMIICEDGTVCAREGDFEDTYLFAYGNHNSIECLHDFLELSGKVPMLPRSVLGNWWTRYYPYSEQEYKELLDRFKAEEIPIAVAVLDMDWHITDIEKSHGTGWTGYTWNKELFPNPEDFLKYLHREGYMVGLNLHDREGIAPHEECYREMAEELGLDPDKGETIQFDFGNPKYIEAYFKYTHHNNEKRGVDFWWTDGFPKNNGSDPKSDIPWMLNHYHYIDNCKNNNRGVIFSRYAGIGSQRYPMGFSGDTFADWNTLDFMPYFTATASNVGFGWWGHDIGGFMGGERDEELMARWTQYGAFSPITRLHCCENPFMAKEPWNFSDLTHKVMASFLKLRHKMIPYIYTMNYMCYKENLPLIRPMYYYQADSKACQNRNQYFFGDQMIVSPITSHSDGVTNMGKTKTYLPKGIWFDLQRGRKYIGDRFYHNYRTLEEMPVFVKAGGIIPLSADSGNSVENPENLEILIYPGADNEFTLYEDDGKTNDYQKGVGCLTRFEYSFNGKTHFKICEAVGKTSLVPHKRSYRLVFKCIEDVDCVKVTQNGSAVEFEKEYCGGSVIISVKNVSGELDVSFETQVEISSNDRKKEIFDLLLRMQMSYMDKMFIYNQFKEATTVAGELNAINSLNIDENVKNAAVEIITADCE